MVRDFFHRTSLAFMITGGSAIVCKINVRFLFFPLSTETLLSDMHTIPSMVSAIICYVDIHKVCGPDVVILVMVFDVYSRIGSSSL